MNLTDARFGDAQNRADLSQGQALVVIEGHDQTLALGEAAYGVSQKVPSLLLLERLPWSSDAGIREKITQCRPDSFARIEQFVERNESEAGDFAELILECRYRDVHVLGEFILGRAALQLVLEFVK